MTFAASDTSSLLKSSASVGSLSTYNKKSHNSLSNHLLNSSVHSTSFMKMYGQQIVGHDAVHGELLPLSSPAFPGSRTSNTGSRSRLSSPDASIMESPMAEKGA